MSRTEGNPDTWPPAGPLAVLVSGGLDSAVLLGEAARAGGPVFPLYVRAGLFWEEVELDYLRRYLTALAAPDVRPLRVLEQPVADVYGPHWSTTGRGVPGADTPDDAVFLPGRNLLLLTKPLLWCHLNGVPALALAPLKGNPFPDATDEFFEGFERLLNRAVGGDVRVLRPYASLGKVEVLRRGRDLPLGESFSCIRPVRGLHCGRCNKCAERRQAFRAAELPDPTRYDGEE
ncbi:MAG TPA: 7-cyano-7-deazaguanine synthase [Gemmataceae bacterium]